MSSVPEGWAVCALRTVFSLARGGIEPSNYPDELFEYFSLPTFDSTGSSSKTLGHEIESNKTLLDKPAVLVSKLNPRKPRVVLADQKAGLRQVVSTEFMAYQPVNDGVHIPYWKWALLDEQFHKRMQRVATGSTNSHVRVTPSETLRWKVLVPPEPEQQKIASILTSVDEVIDKTEAQISKLQDLKKGMMQELLTKGIGHSEFKDSPVGRIPKSWEVGELANFCDLQVGYAFKSQWFTKDEGVPLLRGENVGFGKPTWANTERLPREKLEAYASYVLNVGDVIIGMDRTFTKSGVKITRLSGQDVPSLLVQRVGRFQSKALTQNFMWQLVRSENFLRHLTNTQKGMDIPHLSKSEILEAVVAIPSAAEQKRLADILEGVDLRIEEKMRKIKVTANLKRALMQDLLTGKVRVKVG